LLTITGVAKGILKKPTDATSLAKKMPHLGDKNDRHDMLIAEFKQAHRRMFAANSSTSSSVGDASESESDGNTVSLIHSKESTASLAGKVATNDDNKDTPVMSLAASDEGQELSSGGVNGSVKPKAPPPPPPVKTSRLLSAQLSSSSSESSLPSTRSMSTFKPDRYFWDVKKFIPPLYCNVFL
jgi:hypothetical protein